MNTIIRMKLKWRTIERLWRRSEAIVTLKLTKYYSHSTTISKTKRNSCQISTNNYPLSKMNKFLKYKLILNQNKPVFRDIQRIREEFLCRLTTFGMVMRNLKKQIYLNSKEAALIILKCNLSQILFLPIFLNLLIERLFQDRNSFLKM